MKIHLADNAVPSLALWLEQYMLDRRQRHPRFTCSRWQVKDVYESPFSSKTTRGRETTGECAALTHTSICELVVTSSILDVA
jgi:hypothetical protein